LETLVETVEVSFTNFITLFKLNTL
jgi:hypothetical protein